MSVPNRRTRRTVVLAISLATAVATATARASSPAPGVLAVELVAAVNSPEIGAIDRFASDVVSPASRQPREEIISLLHALREQGGELRMGTSTRRNGITVAQLWAQRVDRGVELRLYEDPNDSSRLMRVAVNASLRPEPPVSLPRERMDEARLVSTLAAEMDRMAATDRLSGVVLVAHGDRILFERAYGLANPSTGERITTATRFHLASMGKMFTSVAIAQLVEAGRLSFDDGLGTLLPDHPWSEAARTATVRQLLSHTAGLGALFDRPRYDPALRYPTSTEQLSIFASEPLYFSPGTGYRYSNEGFVTLGAILEELTGAARATDHLASRVLVPSGMRSTLADPPVDTLTLRAMPLAFEDDDLFGARPRVGRSRGWSGGAAGGQHGTAEDLLRFSRALTGGRLISGPMLDTLTLGITELSPGRLYALGVESRDVRGRRVIGHGGGGPRGVGICADIDVFADGGYTVVVLTNHDAPFCQDLKREITAMLAAN